MPKVAIVIPSINLWNKYTKPCIDSIKTRYPHRVLLVDNASTDETAEEAGKLVSETFAHKRNEERWSCSKSWNFGIRDAFERGYDYVLVVNNDVLLHPDAIDLLVGRFERQKATKDFSEYNSLYPNNGKIVLMTCLDSTGECSEPPAVFKLDPMSKETVEESEHPCFSGFMINKECWDKVGEFDENFSPAYYEDNDYHYRINLLGLKAIVLPTSMFYHYGSRTNAEAFDKPFIDSSGNHRYYVQKWGGSPGRETYKTSFNK